jgi:hypothetical protein
MHSWQSYGGGVISMVRGTALFDAVAISGTESGVRAGAGRRCESGRCARGRVLADAVRGRLQCSWLVGCAQGNGGVVRMDDGAVTFKGGTISKATAVRALLLRLLHVCRCCQCSCFALHVAHDGGCHVVGMPRGVGDTSYVSCCMLRYVAIYVARCGTADGAHGAARCVPNGAGTVCCALYRVLPMYAARLGEGRALRCPSGGAMHSYAGHRGRRDLHGQGHRAFRRCGDIRHRRSTCSAGRRCEPGRILCGGVCRRTWCGADCNGRGCVGCVQAVGGGVVRMDDGAVTFKGGTISNSGAVRARPLRSQVPRHALENSCVTLHCCARRWVPRGGYATWCM